MRFLLLALTAIMATFTAAEQMLTATSLVTCMDNSMVSASKFDVALTPENGTVSYDISATVEIDGNVTARVALYAYGIKVITKDLNPCTMDLKQLCPLSPGQIDVQSQSTLDSDTLSQIPGVAYTVPDIDAVVIVEVINDSNERLACIRAEFSNGKTVSHIAVKWVTAVIAGIGLLTSILMATFGSSYTAAHISTNSLLLFGYFQSVVIVCFEAVDRVPPIASSWAQNLAWSMGLIRVGFMQKIFRWYVQATGGTPTTYLTYQTIAVLVQKRAVSFVPPRVRDFITSHAHLIPDIGKHIRKRNDDDEMFVAHSSSTLLVMRGIKRMAYEAGIEQTSAVLTGFTFFVLICIAVALVFFLVWSGIRLFARNRFTAFQASWTGMLKGTVLRLVYIGFPQVMILSMWEFLERDSAAVIILAVFFLILTLGVLGWNTFRVFTIGRQSQEVHGTPAYLLYSHPETVNKYGFLYVQFVAQHYYFIAVILGYQFVKACFIAFAQSSGKTQGLVVFLIEAAFLAMVSWKRPYMDKTTNVINIIMSAVMTLNALFFLFFSNLFGQPQYVSSIMGVIFFVLNAAFSLVLLIFTLVTCTLVLLHKNPDTRFKPAKDDRASFIQDPNGPAEGFDEFAALGRAARDGHEQGSILEAPRHFGAGGDSDSLAPSDPFNEKRISAISANSRNGTGTAPSIVSLGNQSTLTEEPSTGHARTESADFLNGPQQQTVEQSGLFGRKWHNPLRRHTGDKLQ